jgi:acyl carrier protein
MMTADSAAILTQVTETISRMGSLNGLAPDQDFYEAGITSIMALPILLDLEDVFQVSIPDDRFIAARTPRALAELIASLRGE